MFKGTKYMKSEQFDRLTEDVGGENNASTSRRRHRLPGGGAVEPPRDAALGRGRAAAEPQGRRGQLPFRARRRGGGVPAADPRLALRPLLRGDEHQAVPAPSVPARRDRQHREPRRRRGRRRRRLPRHLLPARQRHPDRHRRLRPAPARRLGRQVLRRHSPSGHAAAAARVPGAAVDGRPDDHGEGAERAAAGGGHDLAGAAGDRRRRAGAAGRRRPALRRRIVAPQPGAGLSAADRDPGELRRRPAGRSGPADRQRHRRRRQVAGRRAQPRCSPR